eukprot:326682_1
MSQVETSEGRLDGESELISWLRNNDLMDAKDNLLNMRRPVTLEYLKEFDPMFLNGFIKSDLKLDGMLAYDFSKAVAKLRESSGAGTTAAKQIVRIVLSQEEDNAITEINQKCSNVLAYVDQLKKDMNGLTDASKEIEAKINQFEQESINKIKSRMNELRKQANIEINKQKQQISNHLQKCEAYKTLLNEAQKKQNTLLTDDKLDKSKRKTKILEIKNNTLNNNILNNKMKFNPIVTVEFDANKIRDFIKNIGHINNYNYPIPPVFSVRNITVSAATIEFKEMNDLLDYNIEINSNGYDDEKKSSWNELVTLKNKKTYLCSNLKENKLYTLRSKCKNEHGWSKYSDIVSFKTKKVIIDSLIMTYNEQEIFLRLMNDSGKNLGNKWNLIYRATRDGWTGANFIAKAGKICKTVIIIHTQSNNVFGGYTTIPYDSPNAWVKDDAAFLILIRSVKNYQPQIFGVKKGSIYAVCPGPTRICLFGSGRDLYVYENCNSNDKSYTSKTDYDIPSAHYLNGDVKNFRVKEIEMYSCV